MRPIPNLSGYYATEGGEVASMRSGSVRVLKSQVNRGYHRVTLSVRVNGTRERHRFEVHRLVLTAYAGLPSEEGLEARHLNGVSTDNRPGNLAWGTRRDNVQDAIRHGTLGPGMRARHRRLTESQVIEIRRRRACGESPKTLAEEFGVHREYIPVLVSGKAWGCVPIGRKSIKNPENERISHSRGGG